MFRLNRSTIEAISEAYGAQAVVISVDPRRVYVASPDDTKHHTFKTSIPGPNGEVYCWYQCTIKGGRETRDLGAYELARACEALGAGEILLNSIDKDGTNSGFDLGTETTHMHTCSFSPPPLTLSLTDDTTSHVCLADGRNGDVVWIGCR